MPHIWTLRRAIARHRTLAALLGVVLVLGVAALNVHAALPEHHDAHGLTTVCVAALSIAVLAACSWGATRPLRTAFVPRLLDTVPWPAPLAAPAPRAAARAGPPGAIVLRR